MPVEIFEAVERFIKSEKNHGYASVAEFVRDAVRRRLDELKKP